MNQSRKHRTNLVRTTVSFANGGARSVDLVRHVATAQLVCNCRHVVVHGSIAMGEREHRALNGCNAGFEAHCHALGVTRGTIEGVFENGVQNTADTKRWFNNGWRVPGR